MALALAVTASAAQTAELAAGHQLNLGVDVGLLVTSGYTAWTDGFVGKLRYSDDDLVPSRAFVEYRGGLTDTLDMVIAIESYADSIGNEIDVTEAFLVWRPVPRSRTKYRLKAGAFYPRISLENTEPGWSSLYTISSSAINTWVAEELRNIGVELSLTRTQLFGDPAQQLSIHASVFGGNDPAGSLLAWRGWSIHDRQSRLGDRLPLASLPLNTPGLEFELQDPYVAPWREIDNRPGYMVTLDWQSGDRFFLRGGYYDNQGEPTAITAGQYAWRTRFSHFSARVSLLRNTDIVAQSMFGNTGMGPRIDGKHSVDAPFESYSILMSVASDTHRVSVRYDSFWVGQDDTLLEDDNRERGSAVTLGYKYDWSDRVRIAAEWLGIKTSRPAWQFNGVDPVRRERQLQVRLQLRF